MIKVAFDVSALDPGFKSHAQRGIGRYVARVSDYLKRNTDPEVSIHWFNHETLLRTGTATKLIDLLPYAKTTLRQQVVYPLKLNRGDLRDASFIHFPAHMDGPAWSPKPYILTVHDLIPMILEPLYRANRPNWRYEFARWLENSSIRNATLLLAVSETTANDVVRLLGVPRERIVVTPNGVEDSFFELYTLRRELSLDARHELRDKLHIPRERPIILYVGGHDERKNVRMVVEIARGAINECAESGMTQPVLVLAGKIHSDREEQRLNEALRDFAMASETRNLGFVSEADLKALYVESAVFLFPSLYEGFGLPVLEASAAGVPVVSSNRGALAEVLGDTGVIFDPEDSIAGCAAVVRILRDRELARLMSERGFQQAKQFSWDRTGKQTLGAYRYAASLLSGKRGSRSSRMPESELTPNILNRSAGNAE